MDTGNKEVSGLRNDSPLGVLAYPVMVGPPNPDPTLKNISATLFTVRQNTFLLPINILVVRIALFDK